MYGVLDKFFSGKTSFTQSEEPIKELPTIVICFTKTNSRKSEYDYVFDFKIKYRIADKDYNSEEIFLREGTNKLFEEILWFEKVITLYQGKCYKLTSMLSYKYTTKHFTDIMIYFNDSISEEDLPTTSDIFITSEKNSYGVVFSDWMSGKVMKASIVRGMYKCINLKPEQHNYLTMNSKCSHDHFYECIGKLIATNLNGSSSQCSLLSMPSLPVCKNNKTSNDEFFGSKIWSIWKNVSDLCTTKLCINLEYYGVETFYGEYNKNVTFGFCYQITSNSTKLYDEYLIYDEINTIASIGGTLGMCIGFSFTGLISCMITFFKNTIFIFKGKLGNHKFCKSKLRLKMYLTIVQMKI